MKRITLILAAFLLIAMAGQSALAQPGKQAQQPAAKHFTVIKQLPITSVKNQYRSGTCWDYATIGFLEAEILRKTGKTYDLCEMFVVSNDYMDNATHYVRMHGYSQISEGGSCDDVIDVIRNHGICPEDAMPAPGSLVGDSLANFKVFFPEFEKAVRSTIWSVGDLSRETVEEHRPVMNKNPKPHWKDSVLAVIEKYVGRTPQTFEYEGRMWTPMEFSNSLGLNLDDYVSITSYTHHPFNQWFVIEAPYKWRLKPSYNIPIDELMAALDDALDKGFTVAWGGGISKEFSRKTAVAELADSTHPTQQMRQEMWDDWRFTYDHVMLIYGKAVDENGKPFYLVKNSWGNYGPYAGTWYMSRDYIKLYTTYIFLNRNALNAELQNSLTKSIIPESSSVETVETISSESETMRRSDPSSNLDIEMGYQTNITYEVGSGEYSGITYIGENQYAVVHDKLNGGGILLFDIIVNPDGSIAKVEKKIPAGTSQSAISGRDNEGVAFVDGKLFVSAEADQSIREYDLEGKETGRALKVPRDLGAGKIQGNAGFEALTYNPVTEKFWTVTEKPLQSGKALELPLQSFGKDLKPAGRYQYQMDSPQVSENAASGAYAYIHGVPALAALDDGCLIVLEREVYVPNGNVLKKALGARTLTKLYLVDPKNDNSAPLKKELLTQFLTTALNLANFEGMCLGPKQEDGSQVLLLIADSQNGSGGLTKEYIKVLLIR